MSTQVTMGTGAFNKFLLYGDLSGHTGGSSVTSPDLIPDTSFSIDGVPYPYAVTQFSFRPNQDVKSEDTGHGVVRIAWEELENSGNLTITIEDVPFNELDGFVNTLLEAKPFRWLGFRGRRYRTNGFTVDYAPEKDRQYYRINLQCVAYRPHKNLPPIPGTEIFPMLDIKRHGAKGPEDYIIHVDGLESWIAMFHTNGLVAWDSNTGISYSVEESITRGGLVSFYGTMAYAVYGTETQTFMRELSPSKGFTNRRKVVDVPYDKNTHFLNGDTLYFISNGQLRYTTFPQNSIQTVAGFPSGARVNPIGTPRFLYSGTTTYGDVVQNCPEDALGVSMTSRNRALLFRSSGVHLYSATPTATGVVLEGPALGADGNPVIVDVCLDMQEFGIFGSPGLPEGYWFRDMDSEVVAEYMPDTAMDSPTVALVYSAETLAEEGTGLTDLELLSNYLQLVAPGALDGAGVVHPAMTELADGGSPALGGIPDDNLGPTTLITGSVGTSNLDITAAGTVESARFWVEATIDAEAALETYVSISDGAWQQLTTPTYTESGVNGTLFVYEAVPGLTQGFNADGQTFKFRIDASTQDVDTDNVKLYSAALAIDSLGYDQPKVLIYTSRWTTSLLNTMGAFGFTNVTQDNTLTTQEIIDAEYDLVVFENYVWDVPEAEVDLATTLWNAGVNIWTGGNDSTTLLPHTVSAYSAGAVPYGWYPVTENRLTYDVTWAGHSDGHWNITAVHPDAIVHAYSDAAYTNPALIEMVHANGAKWVHDQFGNILGGANNIIANIVVYTSGKPKTFDTNGDGSLETTLIQKSALIRSSYADTPVYWTNMRGVHHNGYRYYPFTDQHVFQVFPLL